MEKNNDAGVELMARVKEGVSSFTVTLDGENYSFATRLVGAGRVIYGWYPDDGPQDRPETVAYVTANGTVVACLSYIPRTFGMITDHVTVTVPGVMAISEVAGEVRRTARKTAEEFYKSLTVDPEAVPEDIAGARHEYAYGGFTAEPNLTRYEDAPDAVRCVLGLEDACAATLRKLEEDRETLAAEKQVREFLRRAEERDEFPESVLLPWEVRMLRAVLEAQRLGAKAVRVAFRNAAGTEATLRMSLGNVRGAILVNAPGDERRWALSAWETEDGRPKFDAAVEALGAPPRLEDAERITYGAKTLYEKEAADDGA